MTTAQAEVGDCEAAETTCRQAFDLIGQTGEGWCASELHRVAAEIILRRPDRDHDAAENHLRKAIAIARQQDAR